MSRTCNRCSRGTTDPLCDQCELELGSARERTTHDADDEVIRVAYPQRTDVRLTDGESYAFPRSRLERTEPIHDVDDEGGGD